MGSKNSIFQKGFTAVEAILCLVLVPLTAFGILGWVCNIVKLCHIDATNHIGMLALRVVGVFMAPLGAILGFI